MVITTKELKKLVSLSVVCFCGAFVSYIFSNFQLDLMNLRSKVVHTPLEPLYQAKLTIGKVVIALSAGSLGLVAIVLLFFYIKRFIDRHRRELGILKALGYSNWEIARQFMIFGRMIFLGSLLAVTTAQFVLDDFYQIQGEGLIELSPEIHPFLIGSLILVPTLLFTVLAVIYANLQLQVQTVSLLKNRPPKARVPKKVSSTGRFLRDLRQTSLRSHKILVFFIWFAGFAFSAMLNMSFGMTDLADEWIAVMMLLIGVILSYTTLMIALSALVEGQGKTISMLKVFGYSRREIQGSILDSYRPIAYIGFGIGFVYQYALMNGLFMFLTKDGQLTLDYQLNWNIASGVFVLFVLSYEMLLSLWKKRLDAISLKLVMLAE